MCALYEGYDGIYWQIHRKGNIEVNVHIKWILEVGGEYSPPPSVRKAYTHTQTCTHTIIHLLQTQDLEPFIPDPKMVQIP